MEHREKVMKATADESITKKTSFRKRDQDQWNGFEVVIYHLQTQPEYLTRLIRNYKEKEEGLFSKVFWWKISERTMTA